MGSVLRSHLKVPSTNISVSASAEGWRGGGWGGGRGGGMKTGGGGGVGVSAASCFELLFG